MKKIVTLFFLTINEETFNTCVPSTQQYEKQRDFAVNII